jgi:hypothetical protein
VLGLGLLGASVPFVIGVFKADRMQAALMARPQERAPAPGDGRVEIPARETVAADKSDLANWSPIEFREAAEPVVRRFLEAAEVGDLLPVVRNPERVEGRCGRMFPGGKFPAVGFHAFDPDMNAQYAGNLAMVPVVTKQFRPRNLYLVLGESGLKVDWEAWVGWSETPWQEFLEKRPTEAQLFRVELSETIYALGAFRDESKWIAFRLDSPDGDEFMYGYVVKDSELGRRMAAQFLRTGGGGKPRITVAVKFPTPPGERAQVLIDRLVSETWYVDNEGSP